MTEQDGTSGIFDHEVEVVKPLPPVERPEVPVRPVTAPPAEPEPDEPVLEAAPEQTEPDAELESAELDPEPAQVDPEPVEDAVVEAALAPSELEIVLPPPGAADGGQVSGAAVGAEHAAGDLRVPGDVRLFAASPNGARRSVGIAVSHFNGEVTSKLLDGALAELDEVGVTREAIEVMPVPGAFELPLAAMALAKSRRYSCVLALGCVIRGETPHFDFVAAEAASGVQLAGLETGVPVTFGVLTCDTLAQALERAGGERGNKGAEAARSALEMVEALSQLRASLA